MRRRCAEGSFFSNGLLDQLKNRSFFVVNRVVRFVVKIKELREIASQTCGNKKARNAGEDATRLVLVAALGIEPRSRV